MPKLSIKTIKGNRYLYIQDRVKVNAKSISIQKYVGRCEKATIEKVVLKLSELEDQRLTAYLDYRLSHYPYTILDAAGAARLETIRYYYERFKEHYPDESRRYRDALYIRYVQGTTAIEGNTITLRQAEELLEHDISPAGKKMEEIFEIHNFIALRRYLENYSGDITETLIKTIHELLLKGILHSPGEYRNIQVGIEKAAFEPPPAILFPDEMKKLIAWYRKSQRTLPPFELAILFHAHFEMIHPFVDGNGRVGRALANFILERAGYPTLYLGLEHRSAYLDALAEADEGNTSALVQLLSSIYCDQQGSITDEMRRQESHEGYQKREPYKRIIQAFRRLKRKKLKPSGGSRNFYPQYSPKGDQRNRNGLFRMCEIRK